MVTIGVLAFGIIAMEKLPINLLPDLTYPTITLETRYPGAAPEEVEYLVTRQIEEAVAVIPNIKRVTSSSKPELSQVTIEFNWGRQMDFAILDVSKKVDLLRLPEDVEKPRILRYDPNQDPIYKVTARSETLPLTDLRFFAEEELKKRMEGTPGLASIKVIGGREEIVQVDLDEASMKRYGLTIDQVSQRLQEENVNRAGGSLYENDARFLVRTLNEFRSLNDIGDTILSREGNRKVFLSDVANVTYGTKDVELISRINGEEGVELAFYKEGDANTVTVAREIEKAIKRLSERFEDKLTLETTYVGSTFIQESVDEVKSNAMFGGLIAIIVLLVFLRDIRGTLIVSLAIPISVMATFFLMLQFGVTMNIMSLGGLALGIGMLVDNSIVVLESIFVRKSMGEDAITASEKGTSIVSGAVVASTLTTVVVFLPVVFVEGIGGQLFRDLGMTVSFSLIASLIVSLTLMPTLYALFSRGFFRRKKSEDKPERVEISLENQEAGHFRDNLYSKMLTLGLRFRYVVLLFAGLLIFQTLQLWNTMGLNLVPELAQGDYYVLLEMEEGTPIEKTDNMAQVIEQRMIDVENINVVFTSVGEFNQGVESRAGENLAQINFSVNPEVQDPETVVSKVREILASGPGLRYQIGAPSYFTFRTPIEVEIYNDNQKELEQISREVRAKMESMPGLKDIRSTVADGNPEVQINFKRDVMSQLNLSIGTIAGMLRDKIQGTSATQFVRSGRDVDIVVRLNDEDRQSLDQLNSMTVGYADGRPIFLSSVATIENEVGPSQIKRIDQSRAAVLSAGVEGQDLAKAAAALEVELEQFRQDNPGTEIMLSGQNAEREESFNSLFWAIGLAVFLVYLVMASQFESLFHPFLILFTIPIGLSGGLFALYVTGLEISVIALIGLIMLAGIVVNNAIVLIDYINQLRRAGKTLYDALLIAGNRRFRPIMMTTATTVLGLLPMALGLGSGAELRTPLAISVIGGLVFSTVLTLLIIPVLYATVSRGLYIPSAYESTVENEVTA
jgi:HAE1 family hydrophobic/amphiphilic exporter-1